MKVLLFTHEQDVDGLGCASLAETAKIEYKLVLSKTFELDEKINTTLDKEDISSYDKIIVTDLCPKEETLKMIAKDETLSKKFEVLYHHKTAEEFNCFDFVTVVSEEASIKESGTSLFYKYLKNKYQEIIQTIPFRHGWKRLKLKRKIRILSKYLNRIN